MFGSNFVQVLQIAPIFIFACVHKQHGRLVTNTIGIIRPQHSFAITVQTVCVKCWSCIVVWDSNVTRIENASSGVRQNTKEDNETNWGVVVAWAAKLEKIQ